MIVGIIVACEVGFWVLIILGLLARYGLRWRRVGAVLLALTPIVDALLLVVVAVDLRHGGAATFAHALAAVYLGFSIAYGHRAVRWADVRAAHRFAGGPAPEKLHGAAYARACWFDLLRTVVAAGISALVLWLLLALAAEGTDTGALTATFRVLGIVLVVELLWAVGYTVWPKKQPTPTVS